LFARREGLPEKIAFLLTLVDFAHGMVVFNLSGYLAIGLRNVA
jgi:hypothetical protein